MKHPSEATLALLAGGDLGFFARWRTERHLTLCEQCRLEVQEFEFVQSEVAELNELPGIMWNRLAREMKANIRVGLAAGECVPDVSPDAAPKTRSLFGFRPILASACVALLILAGVWLGNPTPPPAANRTDDVVLQITRNGIELRQGGRALSLLHSKGDGVTYSVGAQGSMRARYVDSDTGYVTINNVYVQ